MLEDSKFSVLIVDDMPENITILTEMLKSDYNVVAALNGEIALKIARSSTPPDIILLDVVMPEMDGFEVCKLLKEDSKTQNIPVIFVTSKVGKEDMSKGIELKAYYYLTKPVNPSLVLSIVRSALNDVLDNKALREELKNTVSIMGLMKNGCFQFRTINETRNLALTLGKMVSDDPVKLVSGLTELMMNAVEHGNLGITYEEKSQLDAQNGWLQEVERRLALPENSAKEAIIYIERDDTEIRFKIVDQGTGFNWELYLEFDENRADHTHGRGIAMAKSLNFSKVEFNGTGNEVFAVYLLK
jgi:response regulator RpfG family c-di-GMP phosphodiesterase